MLLEERRSVLRHILLNIITLGIYGLYATRELARDTNVACHGDGRYSRFGTKEVIFSVLTGGIYQAVWMLGIIERWNNFVGRKGKSGGTVNSTVYLVCRLSVVASFVSLYVCYNRMTELCEDFNDEFFRLDESDPWAKKTMQIIEEVAEKRDATENKVAGFSMIEEYDFKTDRRRLDHSAEEAARAALLAELEEEERRAVVERLAEEAEAEAKAEEEKEKAAERAHRNRKWFFPVFAGLLAIFLRPVILISVITFAFPAPVTSYPFDSI